MDTAPGPPDTGPGSIPHLEEQLQLAIWQLQHELSGSTDGGPVREAEVRRHRDGPDLLLRGWLDVNLPATDLHAARFFTLTRWG